MRVVVNGLMTASIISRFLNATDTHIPTTTRINEFLWKIKTLTIKKNWYRNVDSYFSFNL